MYLIFNRWAVSRPLGVNPASICWGFMQVLSNKLMGAFRGTCHETAHLLSFNVEVRIKTKPTNLFEDDKKR